MSESGHPRVLLVTSTGASSAAVTPVLAALEAADLTVRAIDVGRAGGKSDSALDWMLRAFSGEAAERRLAHEMRENPPDVTVTLEAAATTAMTLARDDAARPAPVIAVVTELSPGEEWAATDADRYLTIDDDAAVDLADHGIDGERIIPVGPVCEYAFAAAGQMDRGTVRRKFGMGRHPVVLLDVAGFGYELTSQVALQLSLINTDALFLFDAGDDADAATALRRQVPTLELNAKLFGRTDDSPLLWRAANVVVARPTERAVSRALVLGASMISFLPEGREGEALAKVVESRRRGATAANALLLSSALEPLLNRTRKADAMTGADGAATAADVAWILGTERREILEERRAKARASTRARVEAAASAAEAAAKVTAAAGGLEDLTGGGFSQSAPPDAPDIDELVALRAEVSARLSQVSKTVFEAREAAEQWEKRLALARKKGDDRLAREAGRASDGERARMHAALAEMGQLQSELERLEKAAAQAPPRSQKTTQRSASQSPPRSQTQRSRPESSSRKQSVDDMMNDMKRKSSRQQATIDDELAALKRKMKNKKKR